MKNGLSYPYQLDVSTFNFTGIRGIFFFIFISFFDGIRISKQPDSSRWDAALSHKKDTRLIRVNAMPKSLDMSLTGLDKTRFKDRAKVSRVIRKPIFGVTTRSDTNRAV